MEDVMHWQERTEMLIGDQGVKALNEAHVLVIGLGGVGGMAAEMLCRAGIGEMTIADSDTFSASNRNRQLGALLSTEGLSKAEAMAARLLDINPALTLHVVGAFSKDEFTLKLLSAAPYNYVLDAVDTLSPKSFIIFHAVQLGLPIVSSMGSGAKLDPSLVRVADLSETFQCTFAFDVRKRLRKMGLESGVQAVFSPEPVKKGSIIHKDGLPYKKSQIGTISYMPAVFGCVCASVVIRGILDQATKTSFK
jgi:tRNA A37 threonylcarbamoyladenosine dehydratase